MTAHSTTLGSEIRDLVHKVEEALRSHPDTSQEWRTIYSNLKSAKDKAHKVAVMAHRMEARQVQS